MISGEKLVINLGNPAKLIKILLAKKNRVFCVSVRYHDVTWDFAFLLLCCLEIHLGTHSCILKDSHSRNKCLYCKQCAFHLLLGSLDDTLSCLEMPPLAHALGLIRKEVSLALDCYFLECDFQSGKCS